MSLAHSKPSEIPGSPDTEVMRREDMPFLVEDRWSVESSIPIVVASSPASVPRKSRTLLPPVHDDLRPRRFVAPSSSKVVLPPPPFPREMLADDVAGERTSDRTQPVDRRRLFEAAHASPPLPSVIVSDAARRPASVAPFAVDVPLPGAPDPPVRIPAFRPPGTGRSRRSNVTELLVTAVAAAAAFGFAAVVTLVVVRSSGPSGAGTQATSTPSVATPRQVETVTARSAVIETPETASNRVDPAAPVATTRRPARAGRPALAVPTEAGQRD